MKRILIIALTMISLSSFAQKNNIYSESYWKKNNYSIAMYIGDDFLKDHWKSGSCLFLAGAFDGQAEAIKFHYSTVKKVFPNINDEFWNPSLSWKNKYKNNDPDSGPKWPSSTTMTVFATDGYHLSRSISKAAIITSVTIPICWGDNKRGRKSWEHYAIDALFYSVCYSAGFWSTYEILYKK